MKRSAAHPGSGHRRGRDAGGNFAPAPAPAPGFTLLELLVVLLLVGLVTALAFPNLERLRDAVTRRTERDFILDQFSGLGHRAMLQGRAWVVFGSDDVRNPEYWEAARGAADAAWEAPPGRAAGDGSDPAFHGGHERYAVDLPQGWELRLDRPLVVYANGVCLGAAITLRHRGAEDLRVELDAPYCRVDPDA